MAKQDKKTQVIKELSQTPIVSLVCMKVGISRNTYYRWKSEDRLFGKMVREAVDEGHRHTDDMVESQLMKKIQAGEWQPMKYYLDKRHRKYKNSPDIILRRENPMRTEDDHGLWQDFDESIDIYDD